MHVLIVGGSADHPGGVEAFCQRAEGALVAQGGNRVDRVFASTAYLNMHRLKPFLIGLATLVAKRRTRPDFVWVQYVNFPDLAFVALARLLAYRVVVTPHLGTNWRSQTNGALRSLSRCLLGAAHQIALISPTQEKELTFPDHVPRTFVRTFLPEKVFRSPIPRPRSDGDPLALIHSARLSEGKGTFLFVDVCRELCRAGTPFTAEIAGNADEAVYAALAARIAEYGLEDQITILGYLDDERHIEHLAAADVLVHLSRIDSYPLIVLESLACSTFPICLDLAGARNMVETYAGCLVPDSTSVQSTVSILRGRTLSSMRAQAQAAAVRLRRDYDWPACVRALEMHLGKGCFAAISSSSELPG